MLSTLVIALIQFPVMLQPPALLQPGTHVPKVSAGESADIAEQAPKVQAPTMQPEAKAALSGLVNRCFTAARGTEEDISKVGSTAYALTFDTQGRIAAIDFRGAIDAPLTPFQTCMRDGLEPWALLSQEGAKPGARTLRMGWPSFTTPNPNPPQLPTRPWHVIKTRHLCPAVGAATAACVTADGQTIRGPDGKLAKAVRTIMTRYHHIERVELVGAGATRLWRQLQKLKVEPNRVDVRENGEPLRAGVQRWRRRRIQ